MFTRIEFIGLLDKRGNIHGVTLKPGLNLITGKSATGKSSVIEIFDYCMGESQNTIPAGVISDNAEIFLLLMEIGVKRYLVGRKSSLFYIIDADANEIKDENDISFENFTKGSMTSTVFKNHINSLYGLDIESTVEREEDKRRGGMKGAPSFRNAMSFILQHQNLVANKLALFYRFDEREKKEQTIDQFKIFAKFVDARYYSLSQEIDLLKKKVEKAKKTLDSEQESIEATIGQINDLNENYKTITGSDAISFFSSEAIKVDPYKYKKALNEIEIPSIEISEDNKLFVERYDNLVKQQNEIQAKLRQSQLRKQEVQSTIESLIEYKSRLIRYKAPDDAIINYSVCPFCHQHTEIVEEEASRLSQAINRVNKEILSVPPIIKPQYEALAEYENEIQSAFVELRDVQNEIAKLYGIIKSLRENDTLKTQAYKIIVRMEGLIEQVIDIQKKSTDSEYESLYSSLKEKEAEFQKKYDVKKNMTAAQNSINKYISDYRKFLPFESRFDGYVLEFNIDNFELNFVKGYERIPMRSVGSGSNWLNAHLCLFLAMASFFKIKTNSVIPSLLFFDQPSQVYFPSIDKNDPFDEEELKKNVTENDKEGTDQDMLAVTNIFQSLYDYCQSHNNSIQVIVTDHADNLKIKGLDNFDSIVAARWRGENEGLVDKTNL